MKGKQPARVRIVRCEKNMPIYEYICKDCNHKFEAVRSFSQADAPIKCDKCGGEHTNRTVSKCWAIGNGGNMHLETTVSGGGCAGCSGGNCAHCGH